MFASRAEGRGFDPQPRQQGLEFFHLLHHPVNAWWPGIEWLLKLRFADESKTRGGICKSVRYITHLFCLAVQAGIYGDAVVFASHLEDRGFDPQPGQR